MDTEPMPDNIKVQKMTLLLCACLTDRRSANVTVCSLVIGVHRNSNKHVILLQAVPLSIDKHRQLMVSVLADQRLTELQQRGGAWLAGLTNSTSGLAQKSPDCRYQNPNFYTVLEFWCILRSLLLSHFIFSPSCL